MNSCDYYQELISSLIDGEISHDEHEALMAHLNTCSRCNAMYAVFHDLSDTLAEEIEPLPEGLHENIMAGVRRSEIIRKNRRLRKLGLRTALTAAACAVLVLFAARGVTPAERADSVSIRSEEEARQTIPTLSPDSLMPAATAAPAQAEYAAPVQTYAPTPVSTWAPIPTAAAPDAYLAAGTELPYTAPQQSQYIYIQPEQNQSAPVYAPPAQPVYQTPEPAIYQTPDPALFVTPAIYQAPEPAVYQTPAPVQATEPVQMSEPTLFQAETFDAAETNAPILMQGTAPAAVPEETQETAGNARAAAEAAAETVESVEEETTVFSLFSEMRDLFSAAEQPDPAESKIADLSEAESFSANDFAMTESTPFAEAESQTAEEPAVFFAAENTPAETLASAKPIVPVSEENVNVRGREARARLLAMIGQSEGGLPEEAELTRVVHVTLIPDDEYASAENLDINIYGDFIFCRFLQADGSSKICRADCSLKNLDDFLKECAAAEAQITPAPTVDPFADKAPGA